MNRLINSIALALPIRDTAQTSTRQQSNAARDNARLVTDDVTKQIASNNNSVQSPRVLDHQHSRAVNQLVPDLKLGELLSHDLADDLAPQTACG